MRGENGLFFTNIIGNEEEINFQRICPIDEVFLRDRSFFSKSHFDVEGEERGDTRHLGKRVAYRLLIPGKGSPRDNEVNNNRSPAIPAFNLHG